jgi:hypothetical protein
VALTECAIDMRRLTQPAPIRSASRDSRALDPEMRNRHRQGAIIAVRTRLQSAKVNKRLDREPGSCRPASKWLKSVRLDRLVVSVVISIAMRDAVDEQLPIERWQADHCENFTLRGSTATAAPS